MFAILEALITLAGLTLVVMSAFGSGPKSATGPAKAVYLASLAVLVLGVVALLWRMVFVNARRTEAADIDIFAEPVREFDYRWRRFTAGLLFGLAALTAAPLLVVWPLLWVYAPDAATHPAVPLMFAFLFLMAVLSGVAGRRGLAARVTIYPDRLAVRGIYSNGSLRWDEARRFVHIEEPAGEWATAWIYYLVGDDRELRVEAAVESPDEFVREVETRTGLTLEKVPQA